MSRKLVVFNIPTSQLSVDKLTSFFVTYGTVLEAKVNVKNRMGWVTMSSQDEGIIFFCIVFN